MSCVDLGFEPFRRDEAAASDELSQVADLAGLGLSTAALFRRKTSMSLHELDILDEPTVETSSADQASLFPFDESLLDLSDDEECPNSLTIDGIQANLAESGSGGGPCLPDDIAQIESLTFPSPKNAVGLLGNAHPGTGLDGASRKSAEGDSPTWTLRPQTSSKLPIKKLRGGSALEVVCPTLCNTNMVVCGAVSTVPLATDTEQACAAMTQVRLPNL